MSGDHEAQLERRYRRLLLAYPTDFRRDRSEEVVSTLLAAAKPGQTAPSIAEARDLVYHGIRTRARGTHRTLTEPVAAHAFFQTGVLTLALATAAAIAVAFGVSVLGQQMFQADGSPAGAYPLAARVGLGLVLSTFPAALVVVRVGRGDLARRLAAIGAAGSGGFGYWFMLHALHTGSETLQASKVFSLVTLLCLPAVMLRRAPATKLHRRQLRRVVVLAAALTVAFVGVVASRAQVAAATYAELHADGYDDFVPRYGVLAETRLWQGMGWALVALGAWHLFRTLSHRGQPQDLFVGLAMTIPGLSYVIGTLVTHVLEPQRADPGDLAADMLRVVLASAAVLLFAALAVAALRRLTHPKPNTQPRPPRGS